MKASDEPPQFRRWEETFGLIGVERIRGITHTDVCTVTPPASSLCFFPLSISPFSLFARLLFREHTRADDLLWRVSVFISNR